MVLIKVLKLSVVLSLFFVTSVLGETSESCLAKTIYHEARGESLRGQIAVGQVVLNRVKNEDFPKTICEVVYQHKPVCQFSYTCDGKKDILPNNEQGKIASNLAALLLLNKLPDYTEGALYFRHKSIRTLENYIAIGNHIFFRRS